MSTPRRDLLHRNRLAEFSAWIRNTGWAVVPTKSPFEVLRAQRIDGKCRTLSIYERAADRAARFDEVGGSTHLTVMRQDVALVRSFLKTLDKPKKP